MGTIRVSKSKQAKPVPISFKPKHVAMLEELGRLMRLDNRSRILQILVENAYNERIKLIASGSNNEYREDDE